MTSASAARPDDNSFSARRDVVAPRRQAPRATSASDRRFGYLFGTDLRRSAQSDAAMTQLARFMSARGGGEHGPRPAGYTYFGQFIDHDVTFDPTSADEPRHGIDGHVNFRTPRFDLTSLYGSGPRDQPYLYDWQSGPYPGVKFLLGSTRGRAGAIEDLPRNNQGRALIGDPRNDENVIVSQLHLLFLKFHNRIVDVLFDQQPRRSATDLFEEAQRLVRWHYQSMIINDFLPKVAGDELECTGDLFTGQDAPFIPVEFSAAVYRFGHSMVRSSYVLNDHRDSFAEIFSPAGDDLRGHRPLPGRFEISWSKFFPAEGERGHIPGMRINRRITPALEHLPRVEPLTLLNLRRGRQLDLPDGRAVAEAMGEQSLSDDELLKSFDELEGQIPLIAGEPLSPIGEEPRYPPKEIADATPLWYYVLCEAEIRTGGSTLGRVGGRIVAEVVHRLLGSDPDSYLLQEPAWKPDLDGGRVNSMSGLIAFAQSTG